MSSDKFNYPIFPDRIYTLTYENFTYKVSGEEIMAYFRRSANLERDLKELENDQLD